MLRVSLVGFICYVVVLSTISARVKAANNSETEIIPVNPSILYPTQHDDRRFPSDVLELTKHLNTTLEILYVLFYRSLCKFNENPAIDTQSLCKCTQGWRGGDCGTKARSCGHSIPSCLNGGVCISGICDCPPKWTGVDCGTLTECKPSICHYPIYQICEVEDKNIFCRDRLPMRLQFLTNITCNTGEDCGKNQICQNHSCVCRPGTVKTAAAPYEKCEQGLVTCFNQEDCSLLSDDLVCRHDTLSLSNKFSYAGRGPYCLCNDDKRIDKDTGLCIIDRFVYLKQSSYVTHITFIDKYWHVLASAGIVLIIAGLSVYRIKHPNQPGKSSRRGTREKLLASVSMSPAPSVPQATKKKLSEKTFSPQVSGSGLPVSKKRPSIQRPPQQRRASGRLYTGKRDSAPQKTLQMSAVKEEHEHQEPRRPTLGSMKEEGVFRTPAASADDIKVNVI